MHTDKVKGGKLSKNLRRQKKRKLDGVVTVGMVAVYRACLKGGGGGGLAHEDVRTMSAAGKVKRDICQQKQASDTMMQGKSGLR